jgi:hypothetical protein
MVDGRLAASPQIFSPPNPFPTDQAASRKLHTTMIVIVRLRLPAQPVDATPSDQLIRQYFPEKTDLSGCAQSDLDRVVFRLNQRSRTTLAVETPASRLRVSVASTH